MGDWGEEALQILGAYGLHSHSNHHIHLTTKVIKKLSIKGWKTNHQANGHHRQAGIAILISKEVEPKLQEIEKLGAPNFIK